MKLSAEPRARRKRDQWHLICLFLLLFFLPLISTAQVSADDLAEANMLSKAYKDDGVICRSSYHLFTFDKGKNSLNDKVVTITEDAEVEFLSLKKVSALTYPEFYNKFIDIKSFKKAVKINGKFITSDRVGVDRGLTDENIFFDDSRVRYFPVRFYDKGSVARVTVKKEFSDAKYLTRLFFQEDYPVVEQTYEFKVPDWLSIDFKPMNFEGTKVEKTQASKGGYTKYTFVMKNIPAYKYEFKELGRAYTNPISLSR